MQSKTEDRPMITVYQADVGYLRKTLSHYALFEQIVGSIESKFAGPMLKINARIEVEDSATFTTSAQSLPKLLDLIGNMDVYSIIDVKMRLADECFDRWLEVPKKDAYKIAFPSGTYLFGCRRADGTQDEVGRLGSIRALDDYRASNAVTHIYIPSTENKEIPIYPCEPFGVKKVDPGSWSQTVSGKAEAEVQSHPAKADPKANPIDLVAKRKAVNDAVSAFEKSQGTILIKRDPDDRNRIGKHLKALGFTVEDWSDWTRRVLGFTEYLGTPASTKQRRLWNSFPEADPKQAPAEPESKSVTLNLKVDTHEATAAIGSFGKAVTDLAREIQVSNLKAAVRNPEVREALFKALRKDGDQETLTALFRLSQEALFGIEWDELNRRKNHHA